MHTHTTVMPSLPLQYQLKVLNDLFQGELKLYVGAFVALLYQFEEVLVLLHEGLLHGAPHNPHQPHLI